MKFTKLLFHKNYMVTQFVRLLYCLGIRALADTVMYSNNLVRYFMML